MALLIFGVAGGGRRAARTPCQSGATPAWPSRGRDRARRHPRDALPLWTAGARAGAAAAPDRPAPPRPGRHPPQPARPGGAERGGEAEAGAGAAARSVPAPRRRLSQEFAPSRCLRCRGRAQRRRLLRALGLGDRRPGVPRSTGARPRSAPRPPAESRSVLPPLKDVPAVLGSGWKAITSPRGKDGAVCHLYSPLRFSRTN